tara:strand:- start:849 stop:1862 length:1014 start_codon:yes stop_codon:yes gene_type:complete
MKKLTYRINPNTQKARKSRNEGKETDDDYEFGYIQKKMKPFFDRDSHFVEDKKSKIVDFTNELNNSRIKYRINHFLRCRQKKNLPNYIPNKYLPEYFNKDSKIDDNTLWFVKPNEGKGGEGIIITKDPKEYVDKDYAIQKQIIPNLVNERIWTVRMYIIANYFDGKLKFWMTGNGIVRLATFEYEKDSQEYNQLITNEASIKRYTNNYKNRLPKNLAEKISSKLLRKMDNYQIRIKNLKTMMKESKDKLKENFEPNKEVNASYHVLGVDIMFDKNEKPYVLEINRCPAFCLTPPVIKYGDKMIFHYEERLYIEIIKNFIKRPLRDKTPISNNFLFEI